MKAIIPAAGYATRLYPLTENKPKPLLTVGGKPMVDHIIEKILELGVVDQIYIVTNDKFYQNFVDWQEGFTCSIPIKVINDGTKSNDDRLGAIGDKVLVMKQENIDDEILDISGDNLFNFSLKEMYKFFQEKKSETIGLYDVKTIELAQKLGVCGIDNENVITDFVEKGENPPSTLASIGVYMYPRGTVKLFKQYIDEGNKPDQPGLFLIWLYKKKNIYGYSFDKPDETWYDIGSLDQYKAANVDYGTPLSDEVEEK
tara:strand:- start:3046 stop:3816 length:771 start_codon:yes stop_codon:yes gene_type:complete